MTVETTRAKIIYAGNGAATEFPVPFPFSAPQDLRLTCTAADGTVYEPTGNYRVAVTASGDAAVVFPLAGSPLPPGALLTVHRQTPPVQIAGLSAGGAFNPEVLEHDVFDRLVMMIQELHEAVSRAAKFPLTFPEADAGDLLGSLLAAVEQTARTAEDARATAALCREYLGRIPAPTPEDAGKVLAVALINAAPAFTLRPDSASSPSGFAHYTLPVNDAGGNVAVSLAGLGHPPLPGPVNPIVNLLSSQPYTFTITRRTAQGFTLQLFFPGGAPGVNFADRIECGPTECSPLTACGDPGAGADVRLLISIPLPPVQTDSSRDSAPAPAGGE
ncbi:MAG: hypothetical protein LBP38_01190 [Desulfovibrio sp.]|jgi:hypothetical protein|nr:hypothetical protein [Desulfovibrio sp.]